MTTPARIKLAVLGLFLLGAVWLVAARPADAAQAAQTAADGEFVGAAKCEECHGDKSSQFKTTAHSTLVTDPHWKIGDRGCEACHGAGAKHAVSQDPKDIFNPKLATAEQVAARCTRCHTEQRIDRQPFHVEHDPRTVSCNDCHSPHQDGTVPNMLIASAPQLCLRCHTEVAADFRKPFHHRALEGGVSCVDCHSPHGRDNTAEARRSAEGLSALCVTCHSSEHGPFVFEHPGVARSSEGCLGCHTAHGSVNNRLLVRATVFQTCILCHAGIGLTADVRQGSSFAHDLSNPRIRDCTVCHTQVHGSNTSETFLN